MNSPLPLKARHRLGVLDGAVVAVIGDEIGVTRSCEMKRLAITLGQVLLDGQLLGTRGHRLALCRDRSQVDVAVGRIEVGDTQLRRKRLEDRACIGGRDGRQRQPLDRWVVVRKTAQAVEDAGGKRQLRIGEGRRIRDRRLALDGLGERVLIPRQDDDVEPELGAVVELGKRQYGKPLIRIHRSIPLYLVTRSAAARSTTSRS
jgi:hypothetical protein